MSQSQGARLHREYPPPQEFEEAIRGDYDVDGSFKNADVDIIAVQGLASTYRRTWSVEVNAETNERYHWLQQRLPQDLKNNDIRANIFAFEYPSAWYDCDPDYTSLEECGRQLLACIERERCHAGTTKMCLHKQDRPIVFIGHSFGGLVIKQAVLLADQSRSFSPNSRHILSSISSIIFLGTPHRGTTFSTLAQLKMMAGGLVGKYSSPSLITVLKLDSNLLGYLQSSFSRLRRSNDLDGLQVYCFYEKKQLIFPPERVVDQTSACLDDAENAGLDANHMELNKFPSGMSENYNTLYSAIREACKTANEIVPPRLTSRVYNTSRSSSELRNVRHWLAPSLQQNAQLSRKLQVHRSNSDSCKWLLGYDFYQKWASFEADENILWMTGIPGSGKSVLAAFTVEAMRASMRQSATVNADSTNLTGKSICTDCQNSETQPSVLYFFGGVDRTHEMSENILGTLIHQLLTIHSDNDSLLSLVVDAYRATGSHSTIETLLSLFAELVAQVAPVSIIIDGVDELSQATDCLSMLGRLCSEAKDQKVNLFLFSQATQIVRETDAHLYSSARVFSITDFTSADITSFITSRTEQLLKLKPDFLSQEDHIRSSLTAKANGMFQWVKTATDQLAQETDVDKLDDYLDDLSSEQARAWESVFARLGLSTMKRKETIRHALMWLCAATRPLSATELHFALSPIFDYSEIQSLASQATSAIIESDSRYAKELSTLLEPLVEVSRAANSLSYFQLAHSTVRTALCTSGSLGTGSVQSWIGFSIEEAHCQVATTCMALCRNSAFAMANSFGNQPLFTIDYAWEHWAYHLKLSESLLSTGRVGDAFERMVIDVTRDTSVLLCALADFVAQPKAEMTWTDADLARLVCFQRAEKSLTTAFESVAALRQSFPVAQQLHQIRLNLQQFQMLNLPEVEAKIAMRLAVYFSHATRAFESPSSTVHTLKGRDNAQSTPAGRQTPSEISEKLWQVVKDLRSLALRFAVNPVYTTLTTDAKSEQFSPINALVKIAGLLEEVGNYPYWADLPLKSDASDVFITNPDDPQHGPARFVMHSMTHQNSFDELAASHQQHGGPPVHLQVGPPDKRFAADDFAISDSHKALVKKVHEMPRTTHLVSALRLRVFRPKDELLQRWLWRPAAMRHVRHDLHIYGNDGGSGLSLDPDPADIVENHLPPPTDSEMRRAVVEALPQILSTHAINYLAYIFEAFAGVSRQAFSRHFAMLQQAKISVENAANTMKSSFNRDSYIDIPHCVCAVLLYCLRILLVPRFGAAVRALRWRELMYCFAHPAQYLEVLQQSDVSIWKLWTWLQWGQYTLHLLLASQAITLGVSLALQADHNRVVVFLLLTVGIYQTLLSLEEALYSMLFSTATSVAAGLVIFCDADRIEDLIIGSFSFWWYSGIGLAVGLSSRLLAGANFWVLLLSLALQGLGLWFLAKLVARYALATKLYRLVRPLLRPLSAGLHQVMRNYGRWMQLSLTVVFLYILWRSFWLVDGWIWDPYNTKTSRNKLTIAYHKAKTTIAAHRIKSIGAAPFGGEQQPSLTLPEMPASDPGDHPGSIDLQQGKLFRDYMEHSRQALRRARATADAARSSNSHKKME